MKPFNLEAALAGKPVTTLQGYLVQEFHLFKKKAGNPLMAIINGRAYGYELDGNGGTSGPLFMASEKKTKWGCIFQEPSNVYPNIFIGRLFDTEQEAINHDPNGYNKLGIQKIEWEE